MVDSDHFKTQIERIISQDYKIEFLGKNFDKIVGLLTDKKADNISYWIQRVIKKDIQPIVVGSKKPYKDWTMNELLVFRYPFIISNIDYRILFVKVKNSIYIEFHLGDHKYYDKVRKNLILKN